jgi:hypothetical protein
MPRQRPAQFLQERHAPSLCRAPARPAPPPPLLGGLWLRRGRRGPRLGRRRLYERRRLPFRRLLFDGGIRDARALEDCACNDAKPTEQAEGEEDLKDVGEGLGGGGLAVVDEASSEGSSADDGEGDGHLAEGGGPDEAAHRYGGEGEEHLQVVGCRMRCDAMVMGWYGMRW